MVRLVIMEDRAGEHRPNLRYAPTGSAISTSTTATVIRKCRIAIHRPGTPPCPDYLMNNSTAETDNVQYIFC